MATSKTRKQPNILITGTPGTGKSTLATKIAQNLGFEFIDIGQVIKENKLHTEFDAEYNSYERMDSTDGGVVLDYHSSDFFPERWFDFVIVLRCPNTQVLYDRLATRDGYTTKKVRENVECEIFGTVFEEATEAYPEDVVCQMTNETQEQMQRNIQEITRMAGKWQPKK